MKPNIRKVIQFIPLWKLAYYVTVPIICAFFTSYMVVQSTGNFIANSTTLSGLADETVSLIGFYKYWDLKRTYGPYLFFLLNGVVFSIYLWILYQYLLRKFHNHAISNVIEQVGMIAEGNFSNRVESSDFPELSSLANHVNGMVDKLQNAMEEERLAEQAKRDLITNVSHDLRTPLTSIVGYLGLIEQDEYMDETELRYYVQTAAEKANRLNKLLDDLFEYTRVQNQGLHVKKEQIDLGEMLSQLAVQFRFHMIEAGMECRLFLPQQKLTVEADGNKLARVFENLITNGLKYGKAGRYLDIYGQDDEDTIAITIVNYGQAISSLDLPFIFERFYRVEKSRSDSDKSSGLGLAIAKGLVELHGGRISAASNAQETAFTVTLPKVVNL
ncbi:MAG: HAMP domain-containing sensor histidine kinase [Neobacillus sp.]